MVFRAIGGKPFRFSNNGRQSLRKRWNCIFVFGILKRRQCDFYRDAFWQYGRLVQNNSAVLNMSTICHFHSPYVYFVIVARGPLFHEGFNAIPSESIRSV